MGYLIIIISALAFFTLLGSILGFLVLKRRYYKTEFRRKKTKKDTLLANELKLYEYLLLLPSQQTYSLHDIAKELEIDQKEICETLELWTNSGDLDKVGYYTASTESFTRVFSSRKPVSTNRCYYCETEIPLTEINCPHCAFEIPVCALCNFPIQYREPASLCPYCATIFHQEHLLEHLLSTEACPKCSQKMNIKQVKLASKPKASKVSDE